MGVELQIMLQCVFNHNLNVPYHWRIQEMRGNLKLAHVPYEIRNYFIISMTNWLVGPVIEMSKAFRTQANNKRVLAQQLDPVWVINNSIFGTKQACVLCHTYMDSKQRYEISYRIPSSAMIPPEYQRKSPWIKMELIKIRDEHSRSMNFPTWIRVPIRTRWGCR